MNLFVLSKDPVEAAQLQCDKHINKMVVESAQMLSTAHRILDGHTEKRQSKSGKRTVDYWIHPDPTLENLLYKAVHHKHPCTIWTMHSTANYDWHYKHFVALAQEFEFRYEHEHRSYQLLKDVLSRHPRNLQTGPQTDWALAMRDFPDCMFPGDAVRSYRAFYQTKQERFAMIWTKRSVPEWFKGVSSHA